MNELIMRMTGFGLQVDLVQSKKCPFCKKDIQDTEFRNEISKREYKISGLCQSCQDDMFGVD